MLVCPFIHRLIVNPLPDNYRAKKPITSIGHSNLYIQYMYVPATSSFWNTVVLYNKSQRHQNLITARNEVGARLYFHRRV